MISAVRTRFRAQVSLAGSQPALISGTESLRPLAKAGPVSVHHTQTSHREVEALPDDGGLDEALRAGERARRGAFPRRLDRVKQQGLSQATRQPPRRPRTLSFAGAIPARKTDEELQRECSSLRRLPKVSILSHQRFAAPRKTVDCPPSALYFRGPKVLVQAEPGC